MNQVELHPYLQQQPVREADSQLGVVTEACSPLAQGAVLTERDLEDLVGLDRSGRVGPDPRPFNV